MIIVSNPFASSTNPSLIVLDHESGKITQEIFIPTVWVGHSDIRHRGDDTPGGLHTGVGHAFLEVLPESRIIPLPTQEVYDILYVPRR